MRRHVVKSVPPSSQIALFDGGLPVAPSRVIELPRLVTVERLTVRKVCADYRREHLVADGANEDRLARFDYDVPKFERIFGADRLVNTIERKDGRIYAETRMGERVCGASARRELSKFIAACNHAKREGRTTHEFKLWKPKGSLPRVEVLTQEQERVLMAAPKPPRLQLLFHLGFNTGARAGAMEELTWDRVDLERRTINFGVQGVDYKNKRRARVPINDALLAVLIAAKAVATDDYVIGLGRQGKCSTTYHGIARVYKKCGIKVRACRHILRHTVATRLLQARVSVNRVAFLLGDTSAVIEDTYAHFIPSDMAADVELLH